MVKPYDQVIYTENGKKYNATVLEVRCLDHLTGKNDEPHIHLGFFAPVIHNEMGSGKEVERKVIGTHDQYQLANFRYDVVHESHEFDEEAQAAGFKGAVVGGRWKERPVATKTKASSEKSEEK